MKIIAGVDEVGRGSLIGPVYAAAVILNKSINIKLIKDSKSLSKNKRIILSNYIKKNSIWAVGKASNKEIAKQSPIIIDIEVELVGAKLRGHASIGFLYKIPTVAFL